MYATSICTADSFHLVVLGRIPTTIAEDTARGKITKLVEMDTNKSAIGDKDGQSTIKLFSIGGVLYMQPSQPEVPAANSDDNTTVVLRLDSTGVSDTATQNIDITGIQEDIPSQQASIPETMGGAEGYRVIDGTEVSAGEVTYQVRDNVAEEASMGASSLQGENGAGEGGHVVVVRDDGIKSGQPRKIICYIHGELPSNVTNDMTFIQQIIDKTGVVNTQENLGTPGENTTVQTVVASDMNVQTLSETATTQLIEGLDPQFSTNVVYSIPTSMISNNPASLGFDTLIQDATNDDQAVVITTDLSAEDSGTITH